MNVSIFYSWGSGSIVSFHLVRSMIGAESSKALTSKIVLPTLKDKPKWVRLVFSGSSQWLEINELSTSASIISTSTTSSSFYVCLRTLKIFNSIVMLANENCIFPVLQLI